MASLVLEGGGMRCVYTSGVLEAFEEAGLSFDTVVGCSAGACGGASFVAGQAWRNRHVYLNYLDGGKFVRFHRLLTGGDVMDVDYLTDEITTTLCPLDLDALRTTTRRLEIGVTDYQTGALRFLNNHDDDLLTAFRATCALPLFYRGQVFYQGRRYIDGGVSEPVPVERAIALGGKTIVSVLTSPIEERAVKRKRVPGALRLFSSSAAVRRALQDRYRRYRRVSELMRTPPPGVSLHVIRPSRPLRVGRTTTDRSRLEGACELGLADGRRFVESGVVAGPASRVS